MGLRASEMVRPGGRQSTNAWIRAIHLMLAEATTEVRLLRAIEAELTAHEEAREERYRSADPEAFGPQPAGNRDGGRSRARGHQGTRRTIPRVLLNSGPFTGLAPRA